jgi:YD repeat-containing protein
LGRREEMIYDPIDRLVRAVYTDATVNYFYDAASRPVRIEDTQSGSITWSYDEANRLLSETTPNGLVSYSYNAASQLLTMRAADRAAVSYGYDTSGRLKTISQGGEVFTYSYDLLSRMTSLQRPNGVMTSYEYDTVNRLARMLHTGASGAIEDYRYSYNLDDEIEAITTLASLPLLAEGKTASGADAANRIAQMGASSFTFDEEGQTTRKTDATGTTQYEWDARGRLTRVTLPDQQQVSYGYDAAGRLARRTSNGVTTSFLYDGADVVVDRLSDGSAVDYLNGPGVDDKLRQTTASSSLYFLQDHLGSTIALTGADGSVVERQRYEPFGCSFATSLTMRQYESSLCLAPLQSARSCTMSPDACFGNRKLMRRNSRSRYRKWPPDSIQYHRLSDQNPRAVWRSRS